MTSNKVYVIHNETTERLAFKNKADALRVVKGNDAQVTELEVLSALEEVETILPLDCVFYYNGDRVMLIDFTNNYVDIQTGHGPIYGLPLEEPITYAKKPHLSLLKVNYDIR